MGDVDLHLAACGQRPDGVVDDRGFLRAGIAEVRDGHLELGVVAANGIDAGVDGAITGDPPARGFDLRLGRKADREGIVGIAVFLPALRRGGIGEMSTAEKRRNGRIVPPRAKYRSKAKFIGRHITCR
jgi:hypothetical protein